LCIHDITRLVASPNDKVFRLKNLSVSRVEIWAYITSVQRKEDAYSCVLDDCTGEIQCFLHIDKTVQNINISDSSLMSMLSNTTLRRFEERVPKIGDMTHLQGVVKNGLWNKVIYLSSSKWKIIDEEESDKLWVDFGERQISLYNEFYKPEIENDDTTRVQQARKIYHVKTFSRQITEKLHKLASQWFACESGKENSRIIEDFYTYELLELSEVVKAGDAIFKLNCSCSGCFSVPEKQHILAYAMAQVLRTFENSGHLFRIEPEDSNIESLSKYFKNKRYKVTLQDSSLIRIVNNIKKESPRTTVKEILLKTTEPTSEFSFLKCLNNSSKVIELVHTTLQSNERSAVTRNYKAPFP